MLKVVVIEDHAMVREGLLKALKRIEPGTTTLGAADADGALELLAADDDVDMVLLDLMLPGTSGMALLGAIRRRFPAIPVVILSALDDVDTVKRALRQGAAGFIPKSSSTESMLAALREVLAGGIYIPPRLRELVEREPSRGKTVADRYGLTAGQSRVLELLMQGKTNRQIAEMLDVAEGTVKIHVSAILKVMKVTNRSQVLLLARNHRQKI